MGEAAGAATAATPMLYQFRLTFHRSAPGYLRFNAERVSFTLKDGTELALAARDADTLSEAASFHIDGYGFADEVTAQRAGERLRLSLRVLNAFLGLGFTLPILDKASGHLAEEIKESIMREHNAIVLDTITGLAVFPYDGRHGEFVSTAAGDVWPSDPNFIFTALDQVWPLEFNFDERVQDTLEILAAATREPSARTKFLLTYLAAERMIDRASRSDEAQAVLTALQEHVQNAALASQERSALLGSLRNLAQESFSSALRSWVAKLQNPEPIAGKPMVDFLDGCVQLRNRIAHNAVLGEDPAVVQQYTEGLRQFVMKVIWTRNRLPSLTIQTPASGIGLRNMKFRIL